MTSFNLRALKLRSGEQYQDEVEVQLAPLEFGGQRYLPVPEKVPAELRVAVPARLAPTIEAAAYFFVSEALTNVGKYANATSVRVELELTGRALFATVTDDGIGGADLAKGSGLRGLADRVQALGGRLEIESVRGKGTKLRAELPTELPGSASA